ncbi:unnamed protein product [Paramecium primaurelia]|uniref:Uncharacterized protein n=1 Tax=Paramecium primaurelia TaxID=5886 RepID=A0A8S1LXY9_PARPR|nr:unnamed protein product [Paramecium primaurelia]
MSINMMLNQKQLQLMKSRWKILQDNKKNLQIDSSIFKTSFRFKDRIILELSSSKVIMLNCLKLQLLLILRIVFWNQLMFLTYLENSKEQLHKKMIYESIMCKNYNQQYLQSRMVQQIMIQIQRFQMIHKSLIYIKNCQIQKKENLQSRQDIKSKCCL